MARSALVAATVVLAGAAPDPARAGVVSLGVQGGIYEPEVVVGDADSSGFVSPVLDVSHEDLGFTAKLIYATFAFDNVVADSFPFTDPVTGADVPVTYLSEGHIELERWDLDVAMRYRLGSWLDGRLGLSVFAGLRWELQENQIVTDTIYSGIPDFLSGLLVERDRQRAEVEASLVTVPFGASVHYTIGSTGLSPFLVGTLFPYARVDFSSFIVDAGAAEQSFQEAGLVRGRAQPAQDGFGGFAVEAGVSWSVYAAFEVPVSLTASYRLQKLEPGDFEDEIQQGIVGAFYHFVDAF